MFAGCPPVRASGRRHSMFYVNSGVSGGRWTLTRWPRLSMPSLTLEWIPGRPGRCTKDSNGQITAGVERCCACCHRHSEVSWRPWSDTARPTALARRSRPGSLQACSDSSPMSERPRYTVSVGALHPGLQCWHAAASEFRQPSPTCRSLPRFRLNTYGRRTFSVAGPMASDCFRRLLTCSRDSASRALGVLDDYVLYKSTHLV